MAINKNHEFEELDGIKCGVVEKYVQPERADFLKALLTFNGYNVVVVPSPPPKTEPDTITTTFTVGVTDYTFNSINAIFGRSLKTKNGKFVTQAYWLQKEAESNDEVPYCDFK